MAKGTVYLYFQDKASIYVALLDKHLSEAIDLLETIKKEKSKAINKMGRIFDEGFKLVSRVNGMIPLVSIENINLTTEIMKDIKVKIQPKIQKIIDSFTEIIQTGIKDKEIKNIDAKLSALIFFSMIRVGFLAQSYAPELKEQSEKIKEIFFQGIKLNKR